jgi:ketosteroid isomerase-like protein
LAVTHTDIVEVTSDVLDAVARRDLGRLLELTDPEVEWQSFFALHGREYHGHEGIRQYLSDLGEAFEYLRPVPGDLLGVGEVVVGVGRVHYRGRASGVETESPAGWMFKFREGKVLRFRAFRDPEQRLEALGLP